MSATAAAATTARSMACSRGATAEESRMQGGGTAGRRFAGPQGYRSGLPVTRTLPHLSPHKRKIIRGGDWAGGGAGRGARFMRGSSKEPGEREGSAPTAAGPEAMRRIPSKRRRCRGARANRRAATVPAAGAPPLIAALATLVEAEGDARKRRFAAPRAAPGRAGCRCPACRPAAASRAGT